MHNISSTYMYEIYWEIYEQNLQQNVSTECAKEETISYWKLITDIFSIIRGPIFLVEIKGPHHHYLFKRANEIAGLKIVINKRFWFIALGINKNKTQKQNDRSQQTVVLFDNKNI